MAFIIKRDNIILKFEKEIFPLEKELDFLRETIYSHLLKKSESFDFKKAKEEYKKTFKEYTKSVDTLSNYIKEQMNLLGTADLKSSQENLSTLKDILERGYKDLEQDYKEVLSRLDKLLTKRQPNTIIEFLSVINNKLIEARDPHSYQSLDEQIDNGRFLLNQIKRWKENHTILNKSIENFPPASKIKIENFMNGVVAFENKLQTKIQNIEMKMRLKTARDTAIEVKQNEERQFNNNSYKISKQENAPDNLETAKESNDKEKPNRSHRTLPQ